MGDEATESVEEKRLNIDVNASYRLVISRIRCTEQEKEKMNQGLMLFIMENIHSEVLCGRPDNESILSRADRGFYMLTAICREESACDMNRKCRELRAGHPRRIRLGDHDLHKQELRAERAVRHVQEEPEADGRKRRIPRYALP